MDLGEWLFNDLLADITRRVFFWAGRVTGAGSHGEAHFERYSEESPIVLRVPMADLLAEGGAELCRYNSGSPRHSPMNGKGRPSPRGADTFVSIAEWRHRPSAVVEVTFVGGVRLPHSTEWGRWPGRALACVGGIVAPRFADRQPTTGSQRRFGNQGHRPSFAV